MAFSAMLEGPNPEVLKPLITQAYPTIVGLLKDINNNVKKWTSICIYRIAELHPYCVLNQFDNTLPVLIENLVTIPKISKNICWVFFYLAE